MSTLLRIKNIVLSDISRFRNISLVLSDRFNAICGSNGVGKTSILNSIASCFTSSTNLDIRRRAQSEESGKVILHYSLDGSDRIVQGSVSGLHPSEPVNPFGQAVGRELLLYVKTNRDFSYQGQQSINRDPENNHYTSVMRVSQGVPSNDIKQWLTNRYLMRPHGHTWPEFQLANLDLAVDCFRILDESVSLAYVDTTRFDVMVNTPSGNIPFEYLSSGFRASYAILIGLIKEIEFRSLGVSAREFAGVILIDELDLHMHPVWQRIIPKALKETFPESQIVVTTHSPHVIQELDSDEVIALVTDKHGDPRQIVLPKTRYGFRGWTIEEILTDVMGVSDVQSETYREAVAKFDYAVDADDANATIEALNQLDAMLHPSSPMRKLFRI